MRMHVHMRKRHHVSCCICWIIISSLPPEMTPQQTATEADVQMRRMLQQYQVQVQFKEY